MKHQGTLNGFQFHELIPDEATAVALFADKRLPDGRHCPMCGSEKAVEVNYCGNLASHR